MAIIGGTRMNCVEPSMTRAPPKIDGTPNQQRCETLAFKLHNCFIGMKINFLPNIFLAANFSLDQEEAKLIFQEDVMQLCSRENKQCCDRKETFHNADVASIFSLLARHQNNHQFSIQLRFLWAPSWNDKRGKTFQFYINIFPVAQLRQKAASLCDVGEQKMFCTNTSMTRKKKTYFFSVEISSSSTRFFDIDKVTRIVKRGDWSRSVLWNYHESHCGRQMTWHEQYRFSGDGTAECSVFSFCLLCFREHMKATRAKVSPWQWNTQALLAKQKKKSTRKNSENSPMFRSVLRHESKYFGVRSWGGGLSKGVCCHCHGHILLIRKFSYSFGPVEWWKSEMHAMHPKEDDMRARDASISFLMLLGNSVAVCTSHMTHFFGDFCVDSFFFCLAQLSPSYSLTPIGLIMPSAHQHSQRSSSSSSSSRLALNLKKKLLHIHTQPHSAEAWKKLFRVVFLQLFSWEGTVKRLKWEIFGFEWVAGFESAKLVKVMKFIVQTSPWICFVIFRDSFCDLSNMKKDSKFSLSKVELWCELEAGMLSSSQSMPLWRTLTKASTKICVFPCYCVAEKVAARVNV